MPKSKCVENQQEAMVPVVFVQNLWVNYGEEPVLTGVDLSIMPGEFVFLLGKTGSGKSTLLKTLYAGVPIADGQVQVAGYHLRKLKFKDKPKLRRQIGMAFQDFKLLYDRSIYDNMEFVLRATGWKKRKLIQARIMEVLDSVGLAEKMERLPNQLSGGEQQKAVIARALLNQPQIIIADEPTGNLDPETSIEILHLIKNVATQYHAAVLFATHDMTLLEHLAAKTVRCVGGKIWAD